MLPTLISMILITASIVLWTISTRRRLVVLDENISNAMGQIGIQLSSCFDCLIPLLDLTKAYENQEIQSLMETTKSKRSIITAKSTIDNVLHQEEVISQALARISMITDQYPELKSNLVYIKAMDAVQIFENMLRTSRLIYNDGVTKLNREIRMFPISMLAGLLGFQQREYLVEKTG